jgi:S1-C subfamily serine protease
MSTFGPRGQVLVIPAATIDRIVPTLLKDGRVARGWLGVTLQAVAVPDALRETVDQSSGLMVMSVVEHGPAAQAGIVAGDIIVSVDRTSTHRFRKIASTLAQKVSVERLNFVSSGVGQYYGENDDRGATCCMSVAAAKW